MVSLQSKLWTDGETEIVNIYWNIFSFHISDKEVLTEDTDSFIIGNRVWVGGKKPGKIAYLGECHFAPGTWAGVVLDEAIGNVMIYTMFKKN